MKNENICVMIKRPGEAPKTAFVKNTLESFQAVVGGYIETVTLCEDAVIICNEEGRLLGLPYNCNVCGCDFVGSVIFAGVEGDEFTDLPITWHKFKQVFPWLYRKEEDR